jgi:DNA replication protein DnaC
MEQVKHLAQRQSSASTAAESVNWIACLRCGQEYLPHAVQQAICAHCRRAAAEAEDESRAREQAIERALGGPKAYRHFHADNFVVTAENRAAFKAVSCFKRNTESLYLHGPCGVGKSHLAAVAARAALESGIDALIVKPYSLLRRVRGRTPEDEQAAIDRLVALPVFVLDDLGVEKATEFARGVLIEIVDRRDMEERAGLIITSNLSLDELAEKLEDDRLPSRLGGLCEVITVGGCDWRQRREATVQNAGAVH